MQVRPNHPKRIFYCAIFIAIGGGFLSLFYYSYLMPLHVDEGGFWFHYTNKSFRYRFIFNSLNPNHTLTIYLAKISLWIFGNNGIGLRFPVIVFAIMSAGILYVFVKRVTGSGTTATLASALLFLNPFFLHYSHELRAYPAYFFFLVCCYLCLHSLLESGDRVLTWVLFLLSFMACYIGNLAAPMFFSILLAGIWILTILGKFSPLRDRLLHFQKISVKSLLIFSVTAAAFFAFVLFYVDRAIVPNLFKVQISESNLLAIPDIFSAFMGYRYLDDPTSLLYAYPTPIWLISLTSLLIGVWCFLKNKHWAVFVFLSLFLLNSLFYISLGTWIPLRSSIFLMPFLLMFQAYGLKTLCERVFTKFFPATDDGRYSYLLLAGIIGCYFFLFTTGKYKNFDSDSGNPFELAKTYLQENTGPNDLIISTLYDTKAGFYLGKLIREKNSNIEDTHKIKNIFYLTPKSGEAKMKFQRAYPSSKSVELLPLNQFENVASFENRGVRPSEVHIFKREVELNPLIHLSHQALAIPPYFGNYSKPCKKQADGEGIRITCQKSPFACANQQLTLPGVKDTDLQFILFHHLNDRGTKKVSFASMKSMSIKQPSAKGKTPGLIPEVYRVNPLLNDIQDLDVFRENVDLKIVSLQKMGGGDKVIFCMVGKLFDGNSRIKSATIFNLDF